MDVKDILVAAKQAVEDADIPQDLRSTAFGKAVDLIAGVPRQTEGAAPRTVTSTPQAVDQSGLDTALDRIANRLELDPAIVEEVYHDEDGEIRITVSARKLDNTKMAGTRQLALLVAAGRQGAGLEQFTLIDKIREFAEEYGRYDPANFSRTINGMGEELNIMGKGKERGVKVRRAGWESAAALVNKLGGGEN